MELLTVEQALHIKGLLLSNTELITNVYQIDIINEALNSITRDESEEYPYEFDMDDTKWDLETGESYDEDSDSDYSDYGKHNLETCTFCNDDTVDDEWNESDTFHTNAAKNTKGSYTHPSDCSFCYHKEDDFEDAYNEPKDSNNFLPDEELNTVADGYHTNDVDTLAQDLDNVINWGNTPQGYEYWNFVHKQLKELGTNPTSDSSGYNF